MYQRKTSILILHLFPNSSGQKIVLSLRERLHSKTIDFPPIVTSEAHAWSEDEYFLKFSTRIELEDFFEIYS